MGFILLFVILLLFAFLDVWYFVRGLCFYPEWFRNKYSKRVRKLSRDELLYPVSLQGLVLPSDLDLMFHMNNSKYLREMDFGRFTLFLHTNIYRNARAVGGSVVVATTMIRYRRSLQLWERFQLSTRIVCWDANAIYVEQRFIANSDGFVCAIALLKMAIKGATAEKVLEKVCAERPVSPVIPPEVESFIRTISDSSDSLKRSRSSFY